MASAIPIEPLQPEDCSNPHIQAFLRDAKRGWVLSPKLVGLFARVPEGLEGWRRMVDGLVEVIGPVTWEVIAHRTASVTGSSYETTHADERVRKEVAGLRQAVCSPELNAAGLSRRHFLAAALAEGVARHEVAPELFEQARGEFATHELVGLCMAASLAHAVGLVSDMLGVSPEAATQTVEKS